MTGNKKMPIKGPLTGVVIVDLSRILAGPYCTMLMADMGARVIKVEPPGKGDDAREYGPFLAGKSAYFMSVNRGKESIALDLKAEKDKRIFEALLSTADILIENFRPGTMEKLGYGWDTLHAAYPRLIYASASGFGHTGPYSKQPAYDMVMQGLGGMMSITGHPDQSPARVGMSIGDIGTGLYTAVAIGAALLYRDRSGDATKIDIGMLDCQIALLENAVMRYTTTGAVPGPLGARHPSITPFEAFDTADGSMIVAAGNDVLWHKLCQALGRADLADDERFATNDQRTRNGKALTAMLAPIFKTRTMAAWIGLLEQSGVPCGPINNIAQALAHPQVAARNMLIELEDAQAGRVRVSGNPLKLSGFADPSIRDAAPVLDADRAAILEELGFF